MNAAMARVIAPKLEAIAGGKTTADGPYAVSFSNAKPPKLQLPAIPAHDDLPGLLAWLTSVLRLDPAHPVTGAKHEGLRGLDGHRVIRRADAPAIRFEPVAAIYSARRMVPMLGTQLLTTDGRPYGFKDEHCGQIAHVLHLACGICSAPDEAQEAAAIVGTFMFRAEVVENHTTYGTPAQRYDAAEKLRPSIDEHSGRAIGLARYLIDDSTGELVIRVSDLQLAAREHVGSSLPRGWLDARMDNLGWTRARLDGHRLSGRAGRDGPHARCDVYRGHLPSDEQPVTT